MDNPFFSIIIPIYNKSRHLDSAISQLIDQSFKDFELIIINDGSTDSSKEKINQLVKNHRIIRSFNQTNKGVGEARNIGINNARGSYVCFFDIDDKVPEKWLERIYLILKNSGQPDLVIYSYLEISERYNTKSLFVFPDKKYNNNSEIRDDFVTYFSGIKFNNGFVWNKVYKKDFLNKHNLRFTGLKIQQDEVFNHEIYKKIESLVTSSEILYEYFVYGKGNIRNTYIADRLYIFDEVKKSFFNLIDFWDLKDKELIDYVNLRYIRNVLNNRNPGNTESKSIYRNKIFSSQSFEEAANLILSQCPRQITGIEKEYLKAVISKSKIRFFLLEYLRELTLLSHGIFRSVKRFKQRSLFNVSSI